jgi:acid phosphatase (class A)
MKRFLSVALLCAALPAVAQAEAPKHLQYLDAAKFNPAQILPPPAAHGSPAEAFELETLHRLLAKASPERLKQAKVDSDNEDPSLFNGVLGFDLKTKPATWRCSRWSSPRRMRPLATARPSSTACGPTAPTLPSPSANTSPIRPSPNTSPIPRAIPRWAIRWAGCWHS